MTASRRLSQGARAVAIDLANPLTDGLACLWAAQRNETFRGTTSLVQPVSNVIGNYAGSGFLAQQGNGSSSYVQIQSASAISNIAASQDFTFANLLLPSTQINIEPVSNRSGSSAGGVDFSVGANSVAGAITFRAFTTASSVAGPLSGYNDGKYHLLFGLRRNGVINLNIDGTASSVGVTDTGAITATQPLSVNKRGANFFAMPVALVALWMRALSDVEMYALSQNPWQLFQPVRHRSYSIAAGAVAATQQMLMLLGVGS